MVEIVYHPDGRAELRPAARPHIPALPVAGFGPLYLEEACALCDASGCAPDGDGPCPRCQGCATQPTAAGEAVLSLIRRHFDGMPFA